MMENTSNVELFLAICAFRLDRNCSAETFAAVVDEAEKRLLRAEKKLIKMQELMEHTKQVRDNPKEAFGVRERCSFILKEMEEIFGESL